jgi:2-iminobutanoate/2-iminopropanoate deaminase
MGTDVSPAPGDGRRESIYIDGFAHTNPIPAAARVGNVVYASSLHGKDPATGEVAPTLDEQVKFLFQHLRRLIEAAGGTTEDIVKVTLWLADRSQRDAINREWIALFPDPESRPARHSIQAELDGGQLVVCDFVAILNEQSGSEGE